MELRLSSPGNKLKPSEVDRIHRDLDKIDRRLANVREVFGELRVNDDDSRNRHHQVTLEVRYGRNHLLAKAAHDDLGQAVREARDEIIRQINDRSRRGHSSFVKGR